MGATLSFPSVELPADRVFLITGGNTGIGYETAKQIAMMGAHVIIACRSEDKAKAAIEKMHLELEEMKNEGKSSDFRRDKLNVEYMIVDLSSLKSTWSFIEEFKASGKQLHVLICNAGIGFAPQKYTEDGYESMFQCPWFDETLNNGGPADYIILYEADVLKAQTRHKIAMYYVARNTHHVQTQGNVNYLSQFLIVAHLLPIMRRAGDDCRILLISSIAHKFGSFNMNTIQGKDVTNFNRMKYYGNSKMYQIMQMYSMVRRLQGSNVTVTSLHPGVVDSELKRNFQDRFYYKHIYTVGRLFGAVRNLYQGAATSINCAVNPDLKGVTGVYFVDAKPAVSSRETRNPGNQDQIWKYTLECLKDYLTDDVIAGLNDQSTDR